MSQVLYVDSLQTDAVAVPEDGTRICMWTNKMVRLVVDLDTNPDGTFGNLPLKPCFRVKTTLFSAGPSVLDMFIRTHAPGDHTEDELEKYRVAVTEMCTCFEDGLAQFLKNVSSTAKLHGEVQGPEEFLGGHKIYMSMRCQVS